jgi:hypothetical protein
VVVFWILVAIGVAGVVAMLAKSWVRRDPDGDLGTVSHQWIAEQRFGQDRNAQR